MGQWSLIIWGWFNKMCRIQWSCMMIVVIIIITMEAIRIIILALVSVSSMEWMGIMGKWVIMDRELIINNNNRELIIN